jgi:hypothetical protein
MRQFSVSTTGNAQDRDTASLQITFNIVSRPIICSRIESDLIWMVPEPLLERRFPDQAVVFDPNLGRSCKLCRMLGVVPQNGSTLDASLLQRSRHLAKSGKVPPALKRRLGHNHLDRWKTCVFRA